MNRLKFEGVPCHHKLIKCVFVSLFLIWCALIFLDGFSNLLLKVGVISDNYFVGSWIWVLISFFVFLLAIMIIEIVSIFTGYWYKWQKPLLMIRRCLYGLGFSSALSKNVDGLDSKTVLSECNRAVNRTYILACSNVYKLIIPLSRGSVSVSNALLHVLYSSNSAQEIIASDLKPSGFRINLRHKHFSHNSIYWILHK